MSGLRPPRARGVFNFHPSDKRRDPQHAAFGVSPASRHHLALPCGSPFTPQLCLPRLSLIFYPACLNKMQRMRSAAALSFKRYSPVNNESCFLRHSISGAHGSFRGEGASAMLVVSSVLLSPQSICTNQGHFPAPLFAHQQLWCNPSITRGG